MLSFWELIQKHKIEIPIIQRDYAQGRKDKTEIRNNFLDALSDALHEKKESLELDFIYGNVENDILQPLDGQQRLTTLFLLHWYLASREGRLNDDIKIKIQKFSYETRTSSRKFCSELINSGIDYDNLLPADVDKNGSLKINQVSKTIIDSPWFFLSWKKDPTIKAMLIMIDAIHNKFSNSSNLWEKLTNDNRITFHYIELENFGLSDDLYIKMNARGKPLTYFENFKAKFEQYIDKNAWENELKDNLLHTFSHKIDSVWTDLFWKYKGDDNTIDNKFIKFIAGIAISNYAQNSEVSENKELDTIIKKELEAKLKGKSVTDDIVKRERIERRITDLFNNPSNLKPQDFPSKMAFYYLKKCFDIYSESQDGNFVNAELHANDLSLWDYCINTTVFKDFVNKKETTYKQRVLFYAQTTYLINSNEFNKDKFSQWLRVIRNIIQNSTVDSAATFIGAIGLIKEIANGHIDIYQYLSKENIKSVFALSQTKEEVIKAKLIIHSDDNKNAIFKTEDTNFCKGEIRFALNTVGYLDNEAVFNFIELEKVQEVIEKYLSNKDITNEFRRALLTIGNNDFYNYWVSWSSGTDTRKRRLIENTGDLKINFTKNNNLYYLKELLNLLTFKEPKDIIEEFSYPDDMPNWKKRLIKEPELLNKYGQSHYFGISNDNSFCLLFKNKKRPGNKKECKEII